MSTSLSLSLVRQLNYSNPLMSTRRGYHKVRGACLTCKQRKVRCSLERPICYNCDRLGRQCAYTDQSTQASNASSPAESGTFKTAPGLDVELMHQWTAFTCLTISNNPVLIALWRDIVPGIAFHHPFLLQAIFAAAAQHKLHEAAQPSAALVEAASHYHQEGLSTYIHQLNYISESNCQALFCFSQLIVGLSYSRLILSKESVVPGIIEIMDLLKGTFTIATRAGPWLNASVLSPMMNNFPEVVPFPSLPATKASTTALLALSEHIKDEQASREDGSDRLNVLESSIRMVHALLLNHTDPHDRMNKIIGLPIWLDGSFTGLLRIRDQAALVILAFYGVTLGRIDNVWFFKGVGSSLVQGVAAMLSEEWAGHLAWPLLEVRLAAHPAMITQ